jgi:Fur family transcriptional regulator, peroxide stress response regulator
MIINKEFASRMTNQKVKIFEYLKSVKTHPTAEKVYREVKKEIPTITLATVYRNLNLLAEKGEILKLEINKEYRFDADTSDHQHCICKKCWKVMEIFQHEISENAMTKMKCKGFNPTKVNIVFYGTCNDCKKVE